MVRLAALLFLALPPLAHACVQEKSRVLCGCWKNPPWGSTGHFGIPCPDSSWSVQEMNTSLLALDPPRLCQAIERMSACIRKYSCTQEREWYTWDGTNRSTARGVCKDLVDRDSNCRADCNGAATPSLSASAALRPPRWWHPTRIVTVAAVAATYLNQVGVRTRQPMLPPILLLFLLLVGSLSSAAAAPLHPPQPLPPWARGFLPGADLQRLVDAAVASGAASVELPAGDFSFGRAPFVVRGAVNLRVHGQGPTATGTSRTSLWFDPGFGVEILSCVNATVEGFSMDTIAPPFSQAKLVAFDLGLGTPRPTTALVEIEPGFPMPTPTSSPLFNESCPDGSEGVCGEVKMIYWDPASRHMVQGQQMNSAITTAKTVCNVLANAGGGARLCNVTVGQPNLDWTPPPGSLITFSPRVAAGKYPIPTYYKGTLAVLNCSRTLLQHIDTFSAGDMTRLECLGYGRNVYRDVNIRRRAEPPYPARLLASNSDGFHTFSVEHGPVVENCELSYVK